MYIINLTYSGGPEREGGALLKAGPRGLCPFSATTAIPREEIPPSSRRALALVPSDCRLSTEYNSQGSETTDRTGDDPFSSKHASRCLQRPPPPAALGAVVSSISLRLPVRRRSKKLYKPRSRNTKKPSTIWERYRLPFGVLC